jgi:predicted amidophosphoribosyltransferase
MTRQNQDHTTLVFTCPECGQDFTQLGKTCPACDAPIQDMPPMAYTPQKSPLFKAIAWFILIAFLALMAAAVILAFLPR